MTLEEETLSNKSPDWLAAWVTGFTDGEGCFSIQLVENKKFKLGIEIRPSFSLGQNTLSKDSLLKLAEYFSLTGETIRQDKGLHKFETRSLNTIVSRIIPHFEQNPCLTNKRHDFDKFQQICFMMKNGEHLTTEGLRTIILLASEMNLDGNNKTRKKKDAETFLKILNRHEKKTL